MEPDANWFRINDQLFVSEGVRRSHPIVFIGCSARRLLSGDTDDIHFRRTRGGLVCFVASRANPASPGAPWQLPRCGTPAWQGIDYRYCRLAVVAEEALELVQSRSMPMIVGNTENAAALTMPKITLE